MKKDTPALFSKSVRVNQTFTMEELCVAALWRSQKTLEDICAKYGFKDIAGLLNFCYNVLRLFEEMGTQEKAVYEYCNSTIIERLVKHGVITVPKDR